jgi:hypothetical protein
MANKLGTRRSQVCCGALIYVVTFGCLNLDAALAFDEYAFHEIETKYLFGFSIGSGIGLEGERAFEPETFARFGKRQGSYAVTQTALEYEFTPNQYLQIELGPSVSYYNIAQVTGLLDRNGGSVDGFEAALRYLIFDRQPALPLAVTLAIEPEWHTLDATSGSKVVNYVLETRLEADIELVKNRLFLGLNLLYEPETTRAQLGSFANESTFGVSTALAFQVVPKVALGAEVWYLRHYDGLSFASFTGDAVYIGPTVYFQIAPKVLMSAAWNTQVTGHEVGGIPGLNLVEFSHQRAKLLFEFEF